MMTASPAWVLILGGLLLALLPDRLRAPGSLLVACAGLLVVLFHSVLPGFEGLSQALFPHTTEYAYTPIFATVFALAALAGSLFAWHRNDRLERAASLIYAGCAIGVTYAEDLFALFIYWEGLAIASTLVVLAGRTEAARRAAFRYGLMHGLGGVLLLVGIAAWKTAEGTLVLQAMTQALPAILGGEGAGGLHSMAACLILLGLLINAAAPPFSAWLADAYPEGSSTGTVFLSAFTTKTAVFVLLTLFPSADILIPVGLFMVFYGIIYAMLENDMRRILSYSIVNQVGFMVTGIGIGTPLALAGVATHAFCHIIYKALLLMSAGAVLEQTGKRLCSELGGLYHAMRFTTLCAIIGALSISAFPWTSGFVSKSMIASAAAGEHMTLIWMLLMAASAGVFLHAGIKFPWFVFFQKDSGMRPKEPAWNMRLAMGLMAALCLIPGIWPAWLYALLPMEVAYEPYTGAHVVTQLQLLLFAGLAFFVLLPWLQRTRTITLDFDFVYRVLLLRLLQRVERCLCCVAQWAQAGAVRLVQDAGRRVAILLRSDGLLGSNWSTTFSVLITVVMLLILLLLYYSRVME